MLRICFLIDAFLNAIQSNFLYLHFLLKLLAIRRLILIVQWHSIPEKNGDVLK